MENKSNYIHIFLYSGIITAVVGYMYFGLTSTAQRGIHNPLFKLFCVSLAAPFVVVFIVEMYGYYEAQKLLGPIIKPLGIQGELSRGILRGRFKENTIEMTASSGSRCDSKRRNCRRVDIIEIFMPVQLTGGDIWLMPFSSEVKSLSDAPILGQFYEYTKQKITGLSKISNQPLRMLENGLESFGSSQTIDRFMQDPEFVKLIEKLQARRLIFQFTLFSGQAKSPDLKVGGKQNGIYIKLMRGENDTPLEDVVRLGLELCHRSVPKN